MTPCSEITSCISNPCANGTCIDVKGGFRCFCETGRTGKTCDAGMSVYFKVRS
ncbi:MAG: calcium-binding EGF-like domain-containing protein [Gammaproteobacteria bacterium]|nr:calcium-binding EGF-like domain-containing protein [Gammaproteobacteria bacterium]